jgi:hypothetical protein
MVFEERIEKDKKELMDTLDRVKQYVGDGTIEKVKRLTGNMCDLCKCTSLLASFEASSTDLLRNASKGKWDHAEGTAASMENILSKLEQCLGLSLPDLHKDIYVGFYEPISKRDLNRLYWTTQAILDTIIRSIMEAKCEDIGTA